MPRKRKRRRRAATVNTIPLKQIGQINERVVGPKRPKRYKTWSTESMTNAVAAVAEGRMGVNRAALEYDIPRTTLKDRTSGRVTHGDLSGPQPYLSVQEEQELYKFLVDCAQIGYPKTRMDVFGIMKKTLQDKGRLKEFNGKG